MAIPGVWACANILVDERRNVMRGTQEQSEDGESTSGTSPLVRLVVDGGLDLTMFDEGMLSKGALFVVGAATLLEWQVVAVLSAGEGVLG